MTSDLKCRIEGLTDVLVAFRYELENEIDEIMIEPTGFGYELKQLFSFDDDLGMVFGLVNVFQDIVSLDEVN